MIRMGGPVIPIERPPTLGPMRRGRTKRALLVLGLVTLGVGVFVAIAARRSRDDPDVLWEQAQASLQPGRFADAEAALRRIDRLRSRTARDWLLAAQVAIAAGRTDEAI